MNDGRHDGHLGAVYAADSAEAVAEGYDAWAETYDTDMAQKGYRHPAAGIFTEGAAARRE